MRTFLRTTWKAFAVLCVVVLMIVAIAAAYVRADQTVMSLNNRVATLENLTLATIKLTEAPLLTATLPPPTITPTITPTATITATTATVPKTIDVQTLHNLKVQIVDTEFAAWTWRGDPYTATIRLEKDWFYTADSVVDGLRLVRVFRGDGNTKITIYAVTMRYAPMYPGITPCSLFQQEADLGKRDVNPFIVVPGNFSCSK